MLSHFITQSTLSCCLCFFYFLFNNNNSNRKWLKYLDTSCLFTWFAGKSSSCFLFEYNRCPVCSCRADTNFIPLFRGVSDISYKNDFISDWCCQGKTEHLLSIPASPERVLFVGRQLDFQTGHPILCDTCSNGQDFQQSNHPHDWLLGLWQDLFESWLENYFPQFYLLKF